MSAPRAAEGDRSDAQDAVLRALAEAARLRPLTVVVDAAHGTSAHTVLLDAAAATGVRVVVLRAGEAGASSPEPDGARPSDDGGDAPGAVEVLRSAVLEHGADLGLGLGDAGSTVTVLDEDGTPVDEGVVAALVALQVVAGELAAGRTPTVLHDSLTSRVLLDLVSGTGAGLVRAPVGREALARTLATSGAVLGAGHGGRFAFRDLTDGAPAGLVAGLHVLVALAGQAHPMSVLAELYQPYVSTGVLAVAVDDAAAAVERVRHAYVTLQGAGPVIADELDGLTVSHWDAAPQWWLALRAPGGPGAVQLLVEAADEDIMDKVRDDVLALLREDH